MSIGKLGAVSFWAMILLIFGCQSAEETPSLQLHWKLERNLERNDQTYHEAIFTLKNTSSQTVDDNWTLYWNQAPKTFLETESPQKVDIANINGDFYRLQPAPGFRLAPGATLEIRATSAGWMIKESDAPVGVYLVWQTDEGEVIQPVSDYEIAPFTEPEQLSRSSADAEPIPTPAYRYAQNVHLQELAASELYPFLPTPARVEKGKGTYLLPEQVVWQAEDGLSNELAYLREILRRDYTIEGQSGKEPHIRLSLDPSLEKPEAYVLEISDKGIHIRGQDVAGVFYGIQSLLALAEETDGGLQFPVLGIEDAPAYAYRGFHLDLGRNFQSKETLLRVVDLLARYKVNKLLFYISEDEGWRLEIEELPELTQVGARRGHTSNDSLYLQPGYGSGPDPDDPASHGNGYFTRSDYIELLRYATDRHVEVIPAVNLPAHARAAIKAMEYRYHRLMAEGREVEALEYRLADPNDRSQYRSAQNYTDNVACVCRDQIYRFYETVVDDIIEIYEEAGAPLQMIHTGGDEVPAGAWTRSPICDEYLKDHPEIRNTRNLQAHFFDRLSRIIQQKGLQTGGWEEVVMEFDEQGDWQVNPAFVGREVYPYIWNNIWGQQDLGYRIANQGYPVILCPVTNFYFDLAYDKDPREPGLYWAGFNDTRDAFNFIPSNLFLSTLEDDLSRPLDPSTDYVDMERLTAEGAQNIVGLQSQLWSETVRGRDMLEHYILPKLIGFAQRAWEGDPDWATGPEEERQANQDADWNRFIQTVGRKELPRLDELNGGYNYRLPPPGIKLENDTVYLNTAYPGLAIRYTIDGSEPSGDSPLYTSPFHLHTGGEVRARCFDTRGRSGLTSIANQNLAQ